MRNTNNKQKWYKRVLTRLLSLNTETRKHLLIALLPISVSIVGVSEIDKLTKQSPEHGLEYDLLASNIASKYDEVNVRQILDTEYEISAKNVVSNVSSNEYVEPTKKYTPNVVYTPRDYYIPSGTNEAHSYGKDFDMFANDIAQKESSGIWTISNRYGYMGLYQIGRLALKDVSDRTDDPSLKGIHKIVTKSKFDKNPNIFPVELQTKVFREILKNNKAYLRDYYKYIGTVVGGVQITESGLLASAHLVGHRGIKKFLDSNGRVDTKDGNGVKCSTYLKQFSHYNININ